MNELQALNREYLDNALRDPQALHADFDRITDYMKASTAIHHGEYVRTCYKPKLFTEKVFADFAADMKILYGIFAKIMDAYFADASYRALFGFDERTEQLILRADRSISMLPMARIDFFYNEETGEYKYCEFNTDGTSAMNEDRELHNAQRLSAGYREFTAAHSTRTCELFDSWVDTVLTLYRKKTGGSGVPSVAIVDYLECGTVNEFEEFRHHFEAKGVPAEVCDVRALSYDPAARVLNGPAGRPINVIYRRAVTSDVLSHYGESTALLEAQRDGAVLLLGDFHTQLVHNKTIFRVMQAPETLAMLTEAERAFVVAHVPMTKRFEERDLPEVLAHKDSWILKPLDSYGSRGVHAGVEHNDAWWEHLARKSLGEDYLLQEFYMPYVTENYGLKDGAFGRNLYYNLTGVYVYDGTVQGVYSRVSLSPIISSQYSEKTLPTLLVQA